MKFSQPTTFYARWRAQADPAGLRETAEGRPPEKLLQAIWLHQRLRRDELLLVDGRRVRVLHPGFWNHEPGPDFRRALVQFADDAPVSGDVEVDLASACWTGHGHQANPAFAKVVLHVVWEAGRSPAAGPPQLAIKDRLDAPVDELANWLNTESGDELPAELAGECVEAWRVLPPERRADLLQQAGLQRLQARAAQMQGRARVAGLEQALWEAVFRALGYKHNSWPMQNLAETRPRLAADCRSAAHWQARLLGAGGLLPQELPGGRNGAGRYLREIWDYWWRDRDTLADCLLPGGLWRLAGLRPANHPQRRLALASHWLVANDLPVRLQRWFQADVPAGKLPGSMVDLLQASDPFWNHHWTLRAARLDRAQPLLGEPRATDLAVNVFLPWLWLCAVETRQESLRRRAEERFLTWPASEDNAVLKLARQRLLGGAPARALPGAAGQQGLLQIVRDFCDTANARCQPCRFPELLRQWAAAKQDD